MHKVLPVLLAISFTFVCASSLAQGPVENVRWETRERMVWNQLVPGTSNTLYDVLRSTSVNNFGFSVCVKADGETHEVTDPEVPTPGQLFAYLARAQFGPSGIEGPLGHAVGGITCIGQPTRVGVDLYQSNGLIDLNLPPNFFEPGSDPFVGPVNLIGLPLHSRGPWELGSTDTVIERLDPFSPIIVPARPTQIEIEIVELSLRSASPITVTTGGIPSDWNIFITLEPDQPLGRQIMIPTGPDQGFYDVVLPIRPRFIFEQVAGPGLVVDTPGVVPLAGFGGLWSPAPGCPSAPLGAPPHFDPGFCLDILLTSPLLSLNLVPPAPTPLIPPPFIHPAAIVDPNARIGRGAQILAGAVVGPGAVIGAGAVIDNGSQVLNFAVIGEGAIIGPNALVEVRAIVDDQAEVQPFSVIGPGAVIGPETVILGNTQIGQDARIGGQSQIGPNATVFDQVRAVREVTIGDTAQVDGGVFLSEFSVVPTLTFQVNDLVGCEPRLGGSIYIDTPLNCVAADDMVLHDLPQPEGPSHSVPGVEVTPGDNASLPAGLANLGADIDAACVHRDKPGQAYVPTTHDCDDFADELEQALTTAGYDATFTVVRVYGPNPNHHWWNWFWTPSTITIKHHANTDVHKDGKIHWVEPQLSVAKGALTWCTNMDFNGDGKVTYATTPGTKPTDGNARVEVYDSRAAAEAAGKVLD